MKQAYPPVSPFSTRLSGSARETELRLCSIYQWKKDRPPAWIMLLTALAIFSCGGLVSCRAKRLEPRLSMDVQYYDASENYIELPLLVMSEGAEANLEITAINEALVQLKGEYTGLLSALEDGDAPFMSGLVLRENHCLLFPTETERYLNLLFLREEFVTDLNTGHLTSLVYDKEEERQVTLADALALAGQTEEGLYRALAEQYAPELAQDAQEMAQNASPEFAGTVPDLCIQGQTLEAFRMDAGGQPVFYLTARVDDRDDAIQDWVSGCDNIYIWSDGSFAIYDQYSLEPTPLVPAEECIQMEPPLWCHWNSENGGPAGGFPD